MVTNVSVWYNGEFLSDSKILCDSMDRIEFFRPYNQCFHINFLLGGLDAFRFFFKQVLLVQ